MAGILRNKIGGILFLGILFFTSFFGSMLMMGPMIPLMFINPLLYRQINDNLLALWLTLPILLIELFFGTKCKVSGDRLSKSERSIIIMNHRTRLDWMFFWKPLFNMSSVRSEKIILKDDLKHIPGPGWAMQIACYIFLKRKWDRDQAHLKDLMEYFCDIGYTAQYLLFPEGTDLCGSSKIKSDSFANKNSLPKYEYVLHPRTTGFKFIMDLLRKRDQVDAIYDVTIGYPDIMPLGGELDIVRGNMMPHDVHFHIKRHAIADIPLDVDFGTWCEERWEEKEVQLKKFYEGDRSFVASNDPTGDNNHAGSRDWSAFAREYVPLILATIYWVIFIAFLVGLILHSTGAWWHMLFVAVFFTMIQVFYGGIEKLIVDLYYWNKMKGMPQEVGDDDEEEEDDDDEEEEKDK